MPWTEPQDVTSGEGSSVQFNAETVANLRWLKADLDARPRGIVDRVFDDSTNQVLTGSFVTLGALSITFTAEAGRLYEAHLTANFDNIGAGQYVEARIHYGSTTVDGRFIGPQTGGGNGGAHLAGPFEPGPGSITVMAQALAGTPDIDNWLGAPDRPSHFWITDAGAA